MYKRLFSLFAIVLVINTYSNAQVSHGGEPYFYYHGAKTGKVKHLVRSMESSAGGSLKAKYANSSLKLSWYADELISEYDILKSDLSDTLSGIVVKRLNIKSQGAYSLSLYFSEFELTEGAKLFIYNDLKAIGSFTKSNNKDFGSFATQAIPGDNLTIELSYPLGEKPVLVLDKTFHGVKNIFGKSGLKTTSESCNVNINCPEGDEWQIEKRAVCKITSGSLLFSGTLVNTSDYDQTPYVLTAMHAVRDGDVAANSIFYFGYESENCDGTNVMNAKTLSGSELVANTDKLDFALVRLSSNVPESYQAVYAGININTLAAQKSVSIHHPNGDTKKISVNNDPLVTVTYNDIGIPHVLENSHWLVENWEAGTTEGGSSGGPIFDEQHLIVGTLSGGGEACSENIRDNFSKIDMAWDHFTEETNQLAHWLNPSNKEMKAIGAYVPYGEEDIAPFALPKETEVGGQGITVFANIYGSKEGLTYQWNFGEDATPSSATGTGPFNVKYSEPGPKSVDVKVYKDGMLLSEVNEEQFAIVSKNVRIKTNKEIACTKETIVFDVDCLTDCEDLSFEWNFGEDAIPQISNKVSDIQVVYSNSGYKTISLKAYRNEELVESVVKHSYINILEAPKSKLDIDIKDMTVEFNNLSLNADSYSWEFGDTKMSNVESPTHRYERDGKYKVLLITSRSQCEIKDTLITLVNLDYKANFSLYPNPSRDKVKLNFRNLKTGQIDYWLFNMEGRTVARGKFDVSDNLVEYDVSNLPSGIYYLKISIDSKSITKKLVVGN